MILRSKTEDTIWLSHDNNEESECFNSNVRGLMDEGYSVQDIFCSSDATHITLKKITERNNNND